MYLLLICFWMLMSLSKGINATPCTDAAAADNFYYVTRMCQSGSVLSTRVAVDTFDTGSLGYSSCTCTAKLHGGTLTSNTKVTVENYPGTSTQSQCGSTLRISSTTTNGLTEVECNPISNVLSDNFNSDDTVTLTLSRTDESTAWQSGYCILLTLDQQGGTNFLLNVTCNQPGSISTSTPSSTITSTLTSSTSTSVSSTSTPTSSSLLSSNEDTTATQTDFTVTETTSNIQPSVCLNPGPSQDCPIAAVIVPIVLTVLIVSVATVGNVVLYRRRLVILKDIKYNTHPLETSEPASYEAIDKSHAQLPNTYDELHISTSSGRMYENMAFNP